MAKKTVRIAKKPARTVKATPKTGRMQKMVSLPAGLHQRLEEYPETNWSAVARQAFEIKLGELAREKVSKNMTDVVSRLRALKMAADSVDYKTGFTSGKAWAENFAEPAELQSIERLMIRTDDEWDSWFDAQERRGHDGDIFQLISENCLRYVTAEQADHPEILRGFAEGALSIWNEVKDQL